MLFIDCALIPYPCIWVHVIPITLPSNLSHTISSFHALPRSPCATTACVFFFDQSVLLALYPSFSCWSKLKILHRVPVLPLARCFLSVSIPHLKHIVHYSWRWFWVHAWKRIKGAVFICRVSFVPFPYIPGKVEVGKWVEMVRDVMSVPRASVLRLVLFGICSWMT